MMSTDSPNTQTAMQLKFILPNTGLKLMYVCANCVFCIIQLWFVFVYSYHHI